VPGLDAAFAALADPTRRSLLERLRSGPATVGELASPLPMSLVAVQKHLAVLESAGLVGSRKVGRTRHVRLRATALREAAAWVASHERFWSERLDALGAYLDGPQGRE
jgi:DNA-binding transcriptional ArsR family regulator